MVELGQKLRKLRDTTDLFQNPLPRSAAFVDTISNAVHSGAHRIRNRIERLLKMDTVEPTTAGLTRIFDVLSNTYPSLSLPTMTFLQEDDGWTVQVPDLALEVTGDSIHISARTLTKNNQIIEDSLFVAAGEKPIIASYTFGDEKNSVTHLPLIRSTQIRNMYKAVLSQVKLYPEIAGSVVENTSLESLTSLEETGRLVPFRREDVPPGLSPKQQDMLINRSMWLQDVDKSRVGGRLYVSPEDGLVLVQIQPQNRTHRAITYFFDPDGIRFGLSSQHNPADTSSYSFFPYTFPVEEDALRIATLALHATHHGDYALQTQTIPYDNGSREIPLSVYLFEILGQGIDTESIVPEIIMHQFSPTELEVHVDSSIGSIQADITHYPGKDVTQIKVTDTTSAYAVDGTNIIELSPDGVQFNGHDISDPSQLSQRDISQARRSVVRLLQGLQTYSPQRGFPSGDFLNGFRATTDRALPYILATLRKNGSATVPEETYAIADMFASQTSHPVTNPPQENTFPTSAIVLSDRTDTSPLPPATGRFDAASLIDNVGRAGIAELAARDEEQYGSSSHQSEKTHEEISSERSSKSRRITRSLRKRQKRTTHRQPTSDKKEEKQ